MPDGLMLGRRSPDPVRAARSLRITDYLRFRHLQLTPPVEVDHFSRVKDWGLYLNDVFGTCGPAAAANLRKIVSLYVTGQEDSPTQDDVDALYRLQNPGFDPAVSQPGGPDDQGTDLQVMCDDLVKTGIGGVKALGHAAVNVHDAEELCECVTLFGGLLLGVVLETSQQQQTTAGLWTYDPSPVWGRHAVLFGRYASDPYRSYDISWAREIIATEAFDDVQIEEARVVIWPENLKLSAFQRGVNLEQLAADYESLTGRKFPVTDVTPPEAPADPAAAPLADVAPPVTPEAPPPPLPVPDSDPVGTFDQAVQAAAAQLVADAQGTAGQQVAAALAQGRLIVNQLDAWLTQNGA